MLLMIRKLLLELYPRPGWHPTIIREGRALYSKEEPGWLMGSSRSKGISLNSCSLTASSPEQFLGFYPSEDVSPS